MARQSILIVTMCFILPATVLADNLKTAGTQHQSESTVDDAVIRAYLEKKQNIAVFATASKQNPYQNEPITLKVTLITRHNLANVEQDELKLVDATITEIEAPKAYTHVENGIMVKIAEASYHITPLKTGTIIIPAVVIQGNIAVRRGRRHFGVRVNANPDTFFGRPGMFGFTTLGPFHVASEAIALTVKPPASSSKPWLPAKSIKLTEQWDDAQTFQVGEPITRIFTIQGEGIAASQLPDLAAQLNNTTGLKVYADQPEINNETSDSNGDITLISSRKEHYTLIPQQPGTLTLPAVKLFWWNTNTDKQEEITLQARTIQIKPSVQANQTTQPATNSVAQTSTDNTEILAMYENPQTITANTQHDNLYILIASLFAILVAALAWLLYLVRKIKQLNDSTQNPENALNTKPVFNEQAFAKISTAAQLQQYLQKYGEYHWHTPKNASLETIFNAAKNANPSIVQEADRILKQLQDNLYADKPLARKFHGGVEFLEALTKKIG